MTKYTLNILWCEHRRIFKVCLAVLQHHEMKGIESNKFFWKLRFLHFSFSIGLTKKLKLTDIFMKFDYYIGESIQEWTK